ncbi:hypothetical protein Q4Q35_18975 [Flavivirga aquimarina]|uniref:Lipoprotein n=1 Tax=Flavivirga aquimarina TaxID=2027862 RepID=A0ABT8WFF3_9FLAO|nr:hypothetical protein [Flavivirga aquimarina]MDO5971890.1 hypothetical protein [Flavivirga aquimarina]
MKNLKYEILREVKLVLRQTAVSNNKKNELIKMNFKIFPILVLAISFTISCSNKNSKKAINTSQIKSDSISILKKTLDRKSNDDNDTLSENLKERKIKHFNFTDDYDKILKYFVLPDYDTTKTQIIKQNSALLISPTDKQINYLKQKNGEDTFYIVADDNNYYMSNIITLLDSFNIKRCNAKKRSLTFMGLIEDYGMHLDSIQQNSDSIYWSVILFNKKGNPIFLDMIDPDIEKLKYYMKE